MRWPWEPRPEREVGSLQPGDFTEPCPHCGSTQPAAQVYPLVHSVRRGSQRFQIATGQRFACEDCGKHWNTGPQGVWKPGGKIERPAQSQNVPRETTSKTVVDVRAPLIPRQPPDV